MELNVGLFGGTFDPVHSGHVKIAEAFINSSLIESLWVLLTPDPPHKTEKIQAPYAFRSEMLEAAFEEKNTVKISTVENTLPRPTYTIQTLEFLVENYPKATFYLCIGEDSLANFTDWYRYRDILELSELIVARRPGVDPEDIGDEILEKVHFIDHEPINISSSDVRERIRSNQSVDKLIPESVKNIIEKHSLYKTEQ